MAVVNQFGLPLSSIAYYINNITNWVWALLLRLRKRAHLKPQMQGELSRDLYGTVYVNFSHSWELGVVFIYNSKGGVVAI